jgi:hypothetical protein
MAGSYNNLHLPACIDDPGPDTSQPFRLRSKSWQVVLRSHAVLVLATSINAYLARHAP